MRSEFPKEVNHFVRGYGERNANLVGADLSDRLSGDARGIDGGEFGHRAVFPGEPWEFVSGP